VVWLFIIGNLLLSLEKECQSQGSAESAPGHDHLSLYCQLRCMARRPLIPTEPLFREEMAPFLANALDIFGTGFRDGRKLIHSLKRFARVDKSS
jgi:hypothetical protein